jgi:hypothetical protein
VRSSGWALVAIAAVAVPMVLAGASSRRRARAEAARAEHEGLVGEIRSRGVDAYLLPRLERVRLLVTAREHARASARKLAEAFERWGEKIREFAFPEGHVFGAGLAAVIAFAVWFVCFRAFVELDRELFAGLGEQVSRGEANARLVALGASVLGFVLIETLHPRLLRAWLERMHRHTRWAAGAVVLVVFVAFCSWLPHLAEERSAALAQHLEQLQVNKEVELASSHPDRAIVASLNGQIALTKDHLQASQYADRRIVVAVVALEAATSWSIVIVAAVGAMVLVGCGRRASSSRVDRIEAENLRATQQIYTDMVPLALEAGLSAEEIRRHLPPPPPGETTETVQEPPGDDGPGLAGATIPLPGAPSGSGPVEDGASAEDDEQPADPAPAASAAAALPEPVTAAGVGVGQGEELPPRQWGAF